MRLTLRKCTIADLDLLAGISRKTFVDAFEAQNSADDFQKYINSAFAGGQLKNELENPETEFYFVFFRKRLAGYFKLNEHKAQTDIKTKESLEVERIYVLEEFQGNRIGQWMLNEIKKLAYTNNKEYLWLGVWEHNIDAIRFYERMGFTKFGRHPYYIGKDEQMDWLMKLNLVNLKT